VKKLFSLFAAVVVGLAVLFVGCSKKAPPLVVLTTGETPPFAMTDKSGALIGHDIELIKMFAKDLGRDVEFRCKPFGDVMNQVRIKEGDIAIGGISVTEEREKVFDMVALPHSSGFVLLVPETVSVSGLDDLSEKMVGVRVGSWQEHIAKSSWEKNIRNLFVKSFDKLSVDDIVGKLRTGELAAVVLDTDEGKYILKNHSGLKLVPLDAGAFHMGVVTCKGSAYTSEISKFVNENKDKISALEMKWFSAKSDIS
jgi:polar amino acid transport system substrate-binding protein